MDGYSSPLPLLGIGVSSGLASGRSGGPLPFTVGTTTGAVIAGRSGGPLPFTVGSTVSASLVGRSGGPLPFTIGATAAIIPPTPEGGSKLRFGPFTTYVPDVSFRDDKEFMELLPIILKVIG